MSVNPQLPDQIRAREAEALAAGWTAEQLWEDRFWVIRNGRNRPGLAALMKPGDDLEEITGLYIDIRRRSGVVHRLYHPDRDKPWEKKISAGRWESDILRTSEGW